MLQGTYSEVLLSIGGGVEGECFVIVDPAIDNGNPVVRKLCTSTEEKDLERFAKEHSNLKTLQTHSNIIALYSDLIKDGFGHYYAMELADGGSINHYVKLTNPGLEDRFRLVEELFSALAHTHRKGITHRDLHFGNALIQTGEGGPTLKLADFGFSRNEHAGIPSNDLWTLKMPYLTPPERLFDLEFKDRHLQYRRADIHAAGLHAYYLITKLEPTPYVVALMSSVANFFTSKGIPFDRATLLPIIDSTIVPERKKELYREWLKTGSFNPENYLALDMPEKSLAANTAVRAVVAKCVHPSIDARYNNIEEAAKELSNAYGR